MQLQVAREVFLLGGLFHRLHSIPQFWVFSLAMESVNAPLLDVTLWFLRFASPRIGKRKEKRLSDHYDEACETALSCPIEPGLDPPHSDSKISK
jgi:hypothetical protein